MVYQNSKEINQNAKVNRFLAKYSLLKSSYRDINCVSGPVFISDSGKIIQILFLKLYINQSHNSIFGLSTTTETTN